jgi:hypothetical protein
MADNLDSFLDQFDPQAQGRTASPGPMRDAPNSGSQGSSDDPEVRRILVSIADFLTGKKGKAAVGMSELATDKVGLPSIGSAPRGLARRPEPASASAASEAMNFVGRAAVPTAVGAATGMALGPAGAAGGAVRGVLTTAGSEALAGLVGELAGQGVARAAGNTEAVSASEAGAQAVVSGAFGGAARGASELAVRGIPRAKAGMKSVAALASKYGIDLTPAEITGSKALAGLESWLEKTMLGSGPISGRREQNIEALKAAKDKFLARAGTDKERQAVGLTFFDMVKGRAESFNNAVRELYSRAFQTVPDGEAVQVSNFMDTAERLSKRAKRSPFGGGGAGATGERVVDFFDGGFTYHVPGEKAAAEAVSSTYIPKTKGSAGRTQPAGLAGEPAMDFPGEGYDMITPPAGGRTVRGVSDGMGGAEDAADGLLPQSSGWKSRTVQVNPRVDPYTGTKVPVRMTPQDMIEMRTDLTQAIADYDAGLKLGLRTMSSRQAGAYKMLLAGLEKDMDTYAASSAAGKDFVTKYRAAKGLAKQNFDIFNNPNVVGLLKRHPEAVVSVIGRDSVTEIQAIKRAAGDKGFDQIRRIWLTELLKQEKNATGKSLSNALSNNNFTEDTLREAFKSDPKALAELREIAELQARIGMAERSTPMTGSARVAAQTGATTVASIVGAALGGPIGAGAGVLTSVVAPYKVAQAYLSPQGRKIVLDGLRAPAGSRAKAIAAARLSAFLGKAAVSPGSESR